MELSLARPAMALAKSAALFGARMQLPQDTFRTLFTEASHLEATTPRTASAAASLEASADLLDEQLEGLPPSDVLLHHVSLLAAAAAALLWVAVDQPPPVVVRAARDDARPHLDALRSMGHPSNAAFADAADAFLGMLQTYVDDKAPQPLEYVDRRPASASAAAAPVAHVEPKEVRGGTVAAETESAVTHTAPHLESFREGVLEGPVAALVKVAEAVGGTLPAAAMAFAGAHHAAYGFIVAASTLEKAPSDEEKQALLAPVVKQMSAVAEAAAAVGNGERVVNHIKALEDGVGAMSWLAVDSRPVGVVADAEGAAAFYLDKVLVATKKGDDAAVHREFVNHVRAVFAATKAYIKEHQTMGLRYNVPLEAPAGGTSSRSPVAVFVEEGCDGAEDEETYVKAFEAIIAGPLAAYMAASKTIGAEVEEQAEAFAGAWEAEAELLRKAINMPKPDDIQELVAPIADKMGEVGAVAERVGPRGPLAQHCTAVGESVAALGWVAVDEKATAFVGDMAGAGQFFVDKVKMGAKKTDNPDAHRSWANALEALFAELKAYVKEHHTQQLVWNPPKGKRAVRTTPLMGGDDGEQHGGLDYVTAFKELVDGPLAAFKKASDEIGDEVAEQAAAFMGAWEAEAAFLGKAIAMPKPDDVQDMLAPIAAKMGEVAAVAENVDPRGPLSQHCTAVAESVSALGWVAVDEKATGYVGDMASAGQFFVDKVKMGAKKTDKPDAHRAWAKALENLFAELKSYVKEFHTQKLVWNPPKAVAQSRASRGGVEGEDKPRSSDNYVTAFEELIDGPVAQFMNLSKTIGSEVEEQASAFVSAWKAEAEFLKKAISMPKPDDIQDMLAPIAAKMGEVGSILEKADPRGPLAQHCNALGESVAALGWVAVDEKATLYVGDMAGAGQFFMDKVKMGARNMDNPDAHRNWVKSLENLFADLRAYVKEYHTQKLMWNSK